MLYITHPALRKCPLFYKKTPPPFHFLPTGLVVVIEQEHGAASQTKITGQCDCPEICR